MDIFDNKFIQTYEQDMISQLSLLYPNLPEATLSDMVRKAVSAKCIDRPIVVENTYTKTKDIGTMLGLVHWIETEKPIFTGNGAFFTNHHVKLAPATVMLLDFKAERDRQKNLMHDCKSKGDMEGFIRYKLGQNNEKITMNSYYGAMGQNKSYQYNVSCAGAITSQGRTIISTTLWFDEMFVGNNIIFDYFGDIIRYIDVILKEENRLELYEYISYKPSDIDIVKYLFSHAHFRPTREQYAHMLVLIRNLTDSQKIKVFYKNNLMELCNKNPKITNLILNMVNTESIFLNPYDVPEDIKDGMSLLWELCSEFVLLENYLMYDQIGKYINEEREVVMYSDTDSVFIYTGEWIFNTIEKLTGVKQENIDMLELEKDKERVFKIMNILINIIYIGIHKIYFKLCGNVNIPEDYRKYINIKNESVFDRFILSFIKKNYVYREVMVEGRIHKVPEVSYKGGNLNPKAKNPIVTKRIKDIVAKVTMSESKIYNYKLLKELYDFGEEIKLSILSGSCDYLAPVKVKTSNDYKNPDAIHKLLAVEVYSLVTGDPVNLPGAFNLIDVAISDTNCLSKLGEKCPSERQKLLELLEGRIGDGRFTKRGISYIAIPLKFERIPEWILPFINVDKMCRKHINPMIAMLPGLGVNIDNIRSESYYSSVLKI